MYRFRNLETRKTIQEIADIIQHKYPQVYNKLTSVLIFISQLL